MNIDLSGFLIKCPVKVEPNQLRDLIWLRTIGRHVKINYHQYIRKTCPCNVDPLKPHFYIAKLGYAGVYLFFLFLLQNIDCGYSLEAPF